MSRKALIENAQIYLGWQEEPGNRGEFVKRCLAVCKLPEGYPWCAAFVCYCIQVTSRFTTLIQNFSPSVMEFWNKNSKLPGVQLATPEPGCVICWQSKKNPLQGHMGIVVSVYPGFLITIEGNTTADKSEVTRDTGLDGVYKKIRLRTSTPSFKLLGYLRTFVQ